MPEYQWLVCNCFFQKEVDKVQMKLEVIYVAFTLFVISLIFLHRWLKKRQFQREEEMRNQMDENEQQLDRKEKDDIWIKSMNLATCDTCKNVISNFKNCTPIQ